MRKNESLSKNFLRIIATISQQKAANHGSLFNLCLIHSYLQVKPHKAKCLNELEKTSPDTDTRIDNVMHVMLQCFAKQGEYIDKRFCEVNKRLDGMDKRLEGIEKTLAEIKKSVSGQSK